jgi:hypothetical protein
MHWRLDKYIVDEFVKFTRRIFTYNDEWYNKDIEIVQFSSGNAATIPRVFEQFFEEHEDYPVVTLFSSGGQFTNAALNDIIRVVNDDSVSTGNYRNDVTVINATNVVGMRVPEEMHGESLNAILVPAAWSGTGDGDGAIDAILYQDYGGSKTQVSSASIRGVGRYLEFVDMRGEFDPYVDITDDDFVVELVSNDSEYYIPYDNEIEDDFFVYENSVLAMTSGSVLADYILPAFVRIGGDYMGSIAINCMSKGDTNDAYNMASLIVQYITMAKHAQVSRTGSAINGTILSEVSEFLEKGIYIRGIKQGNVDVRKRGGDELQNIYTITLTIDIFTEWFQDYPADTIKEIDVEGVVPFSDIEIRL